MNTHPRAGGNARLELDIRSKTFEASRGGSIEVARDLRFTVGENEFVCLTGPSGCGKTTALRILLGLDRAFEGTVKISGAGDPRIGVVFQEPLLLPWRTVEENVRLALPKPMRDRNLDTLFDRLGLLHLRAFYPSELSLGLARRAALARALVIEPDILVLDEPFVSLDEAVAQQLRHLLSSIWSLKPMSVLMVTHNLREAMLLADRVVVLSGRPAHVAGSFRVAPLRQDRSEETIDALLRAFRQMFPEGGDGWCDKADGQHG
ncbi:ATP-binding cassette domain-containing protein [Ochrobactrum daejeonense]|nr:ATP-binding cassette domain-containing protein [Brucella daejeonensis]